jgi:hypothetical protein
VRFVGAPVDGFDETNWWHFEAGVNCYLNEYLKLAYYWLRYCGAFCAGGGPTRRCQVPTPVSLRSVESRPGSKQARFG